MPTDLIRYDLLCQDALRGVVRHVLKSVAKDGLLGDHHFFVTFDTRAKGVRLSNRMRERHPEKMTVVLQHQFWELMVTEHAFEVGLSFGGIPERILIPFDSVIEFLDPSVQFALQFEVATEAAAVPSPTSDTVTPMVPAPAAATPPSKLAPRGAASEPEETAATPADAAAEPADDSARNPGGAEVVSLDKFRKK
ncbi:MAG: ClpXP protease specificity-enhancing factor SspB [Alphaproteobacteria bacterium]